MSSTHLIRTIATGTAIAAVAVVGGVALAPVSAAPVAAASDGESGAAATSDGVRAATIQVEGTLRVRIVEHADAAPTQRVLLDTPEGTIELDADDVADATPGAHFSGTVAVPAAPQGSARSAALAADAPLDVVRASVEPAAAPGGDSLSAADHDVYVVMVRPTKYDCSAVDCGITETDVSAAVDTIDDYWMGQSGGAVHLVQADANGADDGLILRTRVAGSCTRGKDVEAYWNKAAREVAAEYGWTGKPGKADDTWYFGDGADAPRKRHLLVLTPFEGDSRLACRTDFTGIASLSAGVHRGGVLQVGIGVQSQEGLSTFAHELGHTLSLEHADALFCFNGKVDVNLRKYSKGKAEGCFVAEYWDGYDIMGYADIGTSVEDYSGGLTALSAPQRIETGMLPGRSWAPVQKTKTVRLDPIDAPTGDRAVKVKDPRTGEVYFVEYRSATGEDAEALYGAPGVWWRGDYIDPSGVGWRSYEQTGVRVLKQLKSGETVALQFPHPNGKAKYRTLALHKKGESFRNRSGGVKVTVESFAGGRAEVRIRVRK